MALFDQAVNEGFSPAASRFLAAHRGLANLSAELILCYDREALYVGLRHPGAPPRNTAAAPEAWADGGDGVAVYGRGDTGRTFGILWWGADTNGAPRTALRRNGGAWTAAAAPELEAAAAPRPHGGTAVELRVPWRTLGTGGTPPARLTLVWETAFHELDTALLQAMPEALRRRALKKAEAWIIERLNGEGGLGAIFPAMVNAYETLDLLGYPAHHPLRVQARRAIEDLLVVSQDSAYCQPCVSPVWDTVWACIALQQIDHKQSQTAVKRAFRWLNQRQLLEEPQDWSFNRPKVRGGGWPFQFKNSHYPDLDDTAAVAYAMHKSGDKTFNNAVRRAAEWICGMQSKNGGFASFDADNDHTYLN
ncbi:MAG: hypothetical protein JW951_08705, partial [Lentisphaerae bacterium]|nr:hypothetical protein [Lentisphaerota bacterium]